MMNVKISTDMDQIAADHDAELLRIKKACALALNYAARGYITDATGTKDGLRKRYPSLKLKEIKPMFSVTKLAKAPDSLEAVVLVRGRALSMARFVVGQVKTRKQGGVFVNIKGQRKFIPHAWVQTMKNKIGEEYQVVFIRQGKKRLPVEAIKTINVPNALNINEIAEVLEDLTHERFIKEFDRQIARIK